jgi:hypothetical protein
VPSILIGSETDPWMPLTGARQLAQQLGSAFVNLGDAGHINTAAGFGPWPRAKYFIDTLVHCEAPKRLRDDEAPADGLPEVSREEKREDRRTAQEWPGLPGAQAFA